MNTTDFILHEITKYIIKTEDFSSWSEGDNKAYTYNGVKVLAYYDEGEIRFIDMSDAHYIDMDVDYTPQEMIN